jgi:hypothetical protein
LQTPILGSERLDLQVPHVTDDAILSAAPSGGVLALDRSGCAASALQLPGHGAADSSRNSARALQLLSNQRQAVQIHGQQFLTTVYLINALRGG